MTRIVTSNEQALAALIPFGKYKNRSLKYVKAKDPAYLEWLGYALDRSRHGYLLESIERVTRLYRKS